MHVLTLGALIERAGRLSLGRGLARRLGAARERADLAALDDRMLRDVGLSRDAAMREAARSFWDPPDGR